MDAAMSEHRTELQRRLLREVNERIMDVSSGWDIPGVPITFRCECGSVGCCEPVLLTDAEYAAARRLDSTYILHPQHAGIGAGSCRSQIAARAVLVRFEEEAEVSERRRPLR